MLFRRGGKPLPPPQALFKDWKRARTRAPGNEREPRAGDARAPARLGPIMIERTKQAKVAVGVMNIMNTLRDF